MLQRFHASNFYLLILCGLLIVTSGAESTDEVEPTEYYSYYTPSSSREVDLERLYDYLSGILREEDGGGGSENDERLLYAEDADGLAEDSSTLENLENVDQFMPWVAKRAARYSGRYAWKRRSGNGISNTRSTSDSRGRYLCNPTREDIFQLLVALHEAREGNSRRIVNFCNRKRPASAIYTNIRFLGKRRK